MRSVWRLVVGLVMCLAVGARAQWVEARENAGPAVGGLPGSRTLKTFDFEEVALGNFENTPMFWSKVVGPGYPAYSSGAFDHEVTRSANSSFKLQTAGGSVAYRFSPPAEKRIPIYPDADYYILAFVRTSQLKHARADLAAWFVDDQGKLVLNTEMHSRAFQTEATKEPDAWQVLYIYMPGPTAGGPKPQPTGKGMSLALQVGILQPQQLGAVAGGGEAEDLGKFSLYQQDIRGAAWFDDIVVFQLPRVHVDVHKQENAATPNGMFGSDERVTLDLLVSDLADRPADAVRDAPLTVRLRVTDASGVVFANEQWHASTTPEKAWTEHFSHAPLPAGLYTATMEVLDTGDATHAPALTAQRQAQFLCLPQQRTATTVPEFGIGATAWSGNPETWKDLPLLLRQLGTGTIQLPAWRREMSDDAVARRDPPFDALVAALRRMNARTIGALSELPVPLALRLGAGISGRGAADESVLALLNADPKLWRPSMAQLVTRLADRIDWWELGSPEYLFSGAVPGTEGGAPSGKNGSGLPTNPATRQGDARAAALFNGTYETLAGLMNQPRLILPWSALVDFDARQFPHAMLDLRLPSVIKPGQIPAYLASFRAEAGGTGRGGAPEKTSAPRVPLIAHLEGLGEKNYGREDRLADFAQRVVFARIAAPELILYDALPQSVGNLGTTSARDRHGPDELLLVYSTFVHALGGSTYAGELALAPGVRGFLFKRTADAGGGGGEKSVGTLVTWNEATGATELDLPLGTRARGIDLVGNARQLGFNPATQLTRVPVSATPLIVEQIDARPLQLRSSFALSTPTIPAGAGSVRTQVLFTNSYGEALSGTLRLIPPKGWTADPPTLTVALAPGASLQEAVTLRYPFTENAGPKQFGARFTPETPPPGNLLGLLHLDLTYPVALTSEQVEMEGFALVQPNGDVSLQQVITNISSTPLNGEAYALVPGFPRQGHYIVGLQPGQTMVKRFIFSAGSLISADGKVGLKAAEIAKFLSDQSATLGIRQHDGKTLITKAIPFD